MEQKVRFKMHKVKKNWVTIGVTALSMVTVAGGTLLADQQVQADKQILQSVGDSQNLLQKHLPQRMMWLRMASTIGRR